MWKNQIVVVGGRASHKLRNDVWAYDLELDDWTLWERTWLKSSLVSSSSMSSFFTLRLAIYVLTALSSWFVDLSDCETTPCSPTMPVHR